MEDENEDVGFQASGRSPVPTSFSIQQQSYISPEGAQTARRLFDSLESERAGYSEDEDEELSNVTQSVAQARQALVAAREKMAAKRWNKARLLLAMSSAFGSPTRTGAFGETIANVAGAMDKPLADRQAFEDARDRGITDIDMSVANLDRASAVERLKALQARRNAGMNLQGRALTVLSRPVQTSLSGSSGTRALSPAGKVAADELGHEMVGSPEWKARVQEIQAEEERVRRVGAGADANDPAEMEYETALASYNMGLPELAFDPFRGLSTKRREMLSEQRRREADQQLKAIRDSVSESSAAIRDAQRFKEANEDAPTGPLFGLPVIDFLTSFSDAAQTMDTITADAARNQRQPGEGQVSNFDAQQFLKAVMGRGKNKAVNDRIADGIIVAQRQRQQFADFMERYAATYGHLDGAREAWRRYAEANPIFDPKKAGSFVLNQNREPDAFKWFRSQRRSPAEDERWSAFWPAEEGAEDERPAFAAGGIVGGEDDSDKPGPRRSKLNKLARSLAQGATFNFSDEILGISPEGIREERAILEEYAGSDPFEHGAAEIAGGLGAGAGTAYALNRLAARRRPKGKAGALLALAERVLPKNPVLRSGAAGAGVGALAGYGASQGEGDNAVIEGTLFGGLLGPLGHLAAKYGITGMARLTDRLRGRDVSAADQKVIEALTRDDMPLDDVAKTVSGDARRQIPVRLGEAGGQHVDALSRKVSERPGERVQAMNRRTRELQADSNSRVQDRVNQGLTPDPYHQSLNTLTTDLYTNAKPLYDAAYAAAPTVTSRVIGTILETPTGRKAAKGAVSRMQDARRPKSAYGNALSGKPSLEFLDMLKREIDDRIGKAEREGFTNRGRSLRQMRKELVAEMDAASPKYAEARRQYAGDLEVLDALKMGRDDFDKLSPTDFAEATNGMSYAEREALRTGVAERLFTVLSKTPYHANAAAKLVSTPAMVTKLRPLFATEKEYNRFIYGLRREHELWNKRAGMQKGAARGPERIAAEGLDVSEGAQAASELLDASSQAVFIPQAGQGVGGPYTAARIMAYVRGKLPMTERTGNELADILNTEEPAKVRATADRLAKERQRIEARADRSDYAGRRAGDATAIAAQPAPWGNLGEEEEPAP